MKNGASLKVTTPGDRQIVLKRTFNAPRRLVFEAMTKPEFVRRWLLGPPGWSMVVCEIDLRVGGAYRYLWRHSDGSELEMHGVYREINPPERIVNTEVCNVGCEPRTAEAEAEAEAVGVAVFTESGTNTILTVTVTYASREARDNMIASGMEGGVAASYDRLADLVVSMQGGSSASATKTPASDGSPLLLDPPQVCETAARLTAYVHLTVPRTEIQKVMGPGIGEVMAAIAASGAAPAGPWFTHHLKIDPQKFDFEICVPVKEPVVATGRVQSGQQPAMKVARTVYHGDYQHLGAAWAKFDAWILANGHTPAIDLCECYLVGPESNPDPATWRTELTRPLVG
jgi:uncharacterized protein YndB with AHSA1/START domain/effector-binding domain-containing protein